MVGEKQNSQGARRVESFLNSEDLDFSRFLDHTDSMTAISVHRAVQLLQSIGHTDGTLSAMARHADLPVSTAARLMAVLERTGVVSRSGKAYTIGPTLFALTTTQGPRHDIAQLAEVHLSALAAESNETAGLAESALDGGASTDLIHVAQVATDHVVAVRDWTGFQIGAHSGCIGFVLMAWWPEATIDRYLQRDLASYGPRTMTDPVAIRERLATIREQGFLWTTDEYAEGVTTVAAPILDRSGLAVASLYVHGPSYRFPQPGSQDQLEVSLTERAVEISSLLGHRRPLTAR